jgi:hypothetical protein
MNTLVTTNHTKKQNIPETPSPAPFPVSHLKTNSMGLIYLDFIMSSPQYAFLNTVVQFS